MLVTGSENCSWPQKIPASKMTWYFIKKLYYLQTAGIFTLEIDMLS